jgi:hypothetical protein
MQKPSPSDPDSKNPSDEPAEELAHYDDRIIGRAFRWSAVAVIVLAIGAVGVVYWLKRKPAAAPPKQTQLVAPVIPQRARAELPSAKFTDVTREAGIDFIHNSGAYGDKLLPETMGSGVAFFDYDNDGAPDLLFVNASYWPGHVPDGKKQTTPALYHNDGHGHFANVTVGSGLEVSFFGMGVATGDYDGDGAPDVLFTGVGGNHLFHNEGGGKFKDVTDAAGLSGAGKDWSSSAAWFDYDNDGKLDLFICNYVRWTKEIDFEVGYKLVGVGRAYGQPMNFEGAFSKLYHNEGGGKFSDVSAESGIQIKNPATGVPVGKALGVAPVDVDGDGRMDLVIANDTVQNFLFHNEGGGRFSEIGALSGIAFDSYGMTRGAMGIDAARFRNDAAMGIVIGNFANEMTALYVSQRTATSFADESITEGIGPASRLLLKFGIFFFDYDLDGRLDVLSANGHLEEEISKVQQSQKYQQPAQLFWNCGLDQGGCFVSVPADKAGSDLFKPIVGRGSAYADIDGDGDLDIVLTQTGGAPLLIRNDQELKHNWIRFKLEGIKANRDAVGAWIRLKAGGQTQSRQVMPTKSYLSQSELPVTFGLGSATSIEEAEVIWPGGKTQKIAAPRINAVNKIREE